MYRRLVGGLARSSVLVVLATAVSAQSGPGIPDVIYPPSEQFTVIGSINGPGQHGHSIMHDGYLAVFHFNPGGVEFYDISNPYQPQLVQSVTTGVSDLSEPHTMAQTNAYGGQHVIVARGPGGAGGTGFVICDWTDIFDPRAVTYDIPGVPGGYTTGVFWVSYQAPYVYAGAGSLGLYVIDASNPLSPFVAAHMPTSQTGGFNVLNTLPIGNLLVISNADGGSGFALIDVSDPTQPQLVTSSTNTSIPYGIAVDGGRVIVAAVSGPFGSPGGNGGHLEICDLMPGFPTVNTHAMPARGGAVVVQDQTVHMAASRAYRKVDISDDSNYATLGTINNNHFNGDWDWVTPIGNLVALGDDQAGFTDLVPHQGVPDNIGPSVTMVVPADGATNQALTSRVGITLSDMIELTSIDTDSFIVRPVGGSALPGTYSNQFGIVNFSPDAALQPNTTYEVVVPSGGMEDWSGNSVPTTFVSRFSTGGEVSSIVVTAVSSLPSTPGAAVTFDVASVSGTGPFQYSWDFGDGSPPTAFSSSSQATHTYVEPGHYSALVTVTNGSISSTDSMIQTVHSPVTATRPTRSSTLLLDEARSRVWNVNADNDTVTGVDAITMSKGPEIEVGQHPRTLAQAPDESIWVVCQDDATIRVLDPQTGASLQTINLPAASAPYGLAFAPDGSAAYVTLRAKGQLAKLDPVSRTLLGTTPVGPDPKGIAVSADSSRIFVTRFISGSVPPPIGAVGPTTFAPSGPGTASITPTTFNAPIDPVAEIYEVSAATFSKKRSIALRMDEGPDSERSGRGLPNYISSLAISPDGSRLWVPSKKDNILRGTFRDGQPLNFESTVRTIASQVDLATTEEVALARIDFNDRDMAFALEFSPLGDYAFIAIQGSNAIDVRDVYTGAVVAGFDGTGLAPQGLVMASDGSTLYVHNFMSRSVSAFDVSGVTSSTNFAIPKIGEVTTVANETLSASELRGKQIFYNAADPRMNQDGYISCASCHPDGGHDGQVWDFTDRGEGVRNTIDAARQGRSWATATCTGRRTSTRSRTSRTTFAARLAATGSWTTTCSTPARPAIRWVSRRPDSARISMRSRIT